MAQNYKPENELKVVDGKIEIPAGTDLSKAWVTLQFVLPEGKKLVPNPEVIKKDFYIIPEEHDEVRGALERVLLFMDNESTEQPNNKYRRLNRITDNIDVQKRMIQLVNNGYSADAVLADVLQMMKEKGIKPNLNWYAAGYTKA